MSINGHVVKELATQVEEGDQVVVDGSPVRAETPVVLALNKPKLPFPLGFLLLSHPQKILLQLVAQILN